MSLENTLNGFNNNLTINQSATYNPSLIQSETYNPSLIQSATYNPSLIQSETYKPSLVNSLPRSKKKLPFFMSESNNYYR